MLPRHNQPRVQMSHRKTVWTNVFV